MVQRFLNPTATCRPSGFTWPGVAIGTESTTAAAAAVASGGRRPRCGATGWQTNAHYARPLSLSGPTTMTTATRPPSIRSLRNLRTPPPPGPLPPDVTLTYCHQDFGNDLFALLEQPPPPPTPPATNNLTAAMDYRTCGTVERLRRRRTKRQNFPVKSIADSRTRTKLWYYRYTSCTDDWNIVRYAKIDPPESFIVSYFKPFSSYFPFCPPIVPIVKFRGSFWWQIISARYIGKLVF